MAGVSFLEKNPANLNFIINELLNPEVKQALFDDYMGMAEISMLMCDPRTIIYGVHEKGVSAPVGIIFFTDVIPYRDAMLYAVVFDPSRRKSGVISSVFETIGSDIVRRFSLNSCTTYVTGKNPGSAAMLEKMGFEKVGTMKKRVLAGGKLQDVHIYYKLLEGKFFTPGDVQQDNTTEADNKEE